MNAQDCLQILREIKDVAFATVDEHGWPQIRIIDVMLVEAEKLYFCTARGKEFYEQLTAYGNEQGVPDGPPYRDGPQAAGTETVDRPDF